MTKLVDLLDPDKWMASGRNLMDFPWPSETENEHKAVLLILEDHPKLALHLARWGAWITEHLAVEPSKPVRKMLTEEQVRDLWEKTR